jgi:hypothetical protein
MSQEERTVKHLRKVLLRVEPIGEDGSPIGKGGTAPFAFVFGVGSQGLSPLEMALEGAGEGEERRIPIPAGGAEALFGHLAPPRLEPRGAGGAARELRVVVERAEPAGDREVIQAMSEASACGSDCCGH